MLHFDDDDDDYRFVLNQN